MTKRIKIADKFIGRAHASFVIAEMVLDIDEREFHISDTDSLWAARRSINFTARLKR